MISVDEAYRLIGSYKKEFGTETVPILQSLDRVLARDVIADRDFPPFDRVTMDGIAVNTKKFEAGQKQFIVENISAAGSPVQTLEHDEHCIEVMTGAMLPVNTDAVIPYEQCEVKDHIAGVNADEVKPYQNIHRQGTDEKKGSVLLQKNTRISPAHISVMGTVGTGSVAVYAMPKIAVCSTGDELVAVEATPMPHQIRQSNGYLLAASLQKENITAPMYHLPDNKEVMKAKLEDILQANDVILLSGAVSKGRFDYLPECLEELGMKTVFHRVAQRPGKPFLFGVIAGKLIFGFPGNPVSTFVCYHLYFRHWLGACLSETIQKIPAKLSHDIVQMFPLTQHLLVKLEYRDGACFAEPVSFSTSGDILSLVYADGTISLSAQKDGLRKDEAVEVLLCR